MPAPRCGGTAGSSRGLSFLTCDKLGSPGSPPPSLSKQKAAGTLAPTFFLPWRLWLLAWLSGNPAQARPPPSLHNWGADAVREAVAQTQVVPPATSSLILDRPTITFGPETICRVKGEKGPEGREEEREGVGGGSGLRVAFEVCNHLI